MTYCYNCFREYAAGSGPCPHCGYDPPKDQGKYPFALPHGSILAGQFITGRVLGQGGFGITYLALDNRLKSRVAIKEFLPDSMAVRTAGTPQITVYTGQRQENFQYGMERFLDEAKVLAKFQGNPHIVGVRSYFEENGTAYFVMDYIEGESFKAYIQDHGGRIPWKEALRILMPVMDALGAVHTEGIIHRDVTPDNIFVTGGGGVKLLDFGSARYSLGDKSRSLDVVLKAGYAPKEQYTRRGRQGPYTDVYSLAACFYSAITGYLPPESLDRADEDDLVLPSTRGIEIPQAVEDVILHGLEVQPADRYQSMEEFRSAMSEAAAEPGEEPEAVPVESAPPEPETDSLSDIQSAPAAEKPRFPEDAGGGAPVGKAEAAGQGSASRPKAPPSHRVRYGILAVCCVAVALIVALAGTFRSPPKEITIGRETIRSDATKVDLADKGLKSSDVSPLANLTNLTELYLYKNQISDVSPLANLTNLTELYLSDNQISDVSPLANLTNLTELSLWGNQISDVSPLANLTNLTELNLWDNQISDVSPLANLTNLTELNLPSNQISDVSPLANLTNLTKLSLYSNQISDVSPLANLTNLKNLYLWGNQISDVSPLANLTNLTDLSLSDNQISDVSPLANLTNLTDLNLSDNQISDVSPLANLTNLTELNLRDNQISDVSPLANLTNLTELDLLSNQISDVSPLANLTNLTELNLSDNQISDVSPLKNLTSLTKLDLRWNEISEAQIAELRAALPNCEICEIIIV